MYKILLKLVNECRRYSKPKKCNFRAWLKRPIFGVHDSQGSAETLVRRGGIPNYHLIACSFSNISAKNYQNRLMCIEVIVCNVSVVCLDTVVVPFISRKILWLNLIRIWPDSSSVFSFWNPLQLWRYRIFPVGLFLLGHPVLELLFESEADLLNILRQDSFLIFLLVSLLNKKIGSYLRML